MSHIDGNVIIILLDINSSSADENKLKNIVANVKTFTDADQCFHFLENMKNEKIFMILSDSFEQYFGHFLNFIQDMEQVYSIYILCNQQGRYEQWSNQYKKLKGAFPDIENISERLNQDVDRCKNNLIPNVVKRDKLDPSYIYMKLLLEVILKIHYDEEAKVVFIRYLREQSTNNNLHRQSIDRLEQSYTEHSPIWWYTAESYLYLILNKALRTLDTAVIIKMGFFIQDLYRQIELLYAQAQYTSQRTVYRGQGLSLIDFDNMRSHLGGLLSFNYFISTTTDRDIASCFAESNQCNPNLVGVHFQIEIDPSICCIPFAAIDDVSYSSEPSSEFLFSVGSTFRIQAIEHLIEDGIWQVNLVLTNDIDPELKYLIDYLRNEIEDDNALCSLALLMNKMGHYDEAQKIHSELFKIVPSFMNDNKIGLMHQSMGNYSQALIYYEKVLENAQNLLPSDHSSLATIYNNIAATHQSTGDYSKSLLYFEKALEINQKVLPSNHLSLANLYNNIGDLYNSMGEYTKALSYYDRTLEIQRKSLPSGHPSLAITYNNIGLVHRSIGNYSIALFSYKKTLDIELHALQPNHPTFVTTYNNIGLAYSFLKDYPTALSYYEKALSIAQTISSSNKPSLALIYNNIGEINYSLKIYSSALSYYEKALEILQESSPVNHPELAAVYNNIGEVYRAEGNNSTALTYYEKTLDIEQNIFSSYHPSLAITYVNTAVVLEAEQRYEDAINYTKQAIDILQYVFGSNHLKTTEVQTYLDTLQEKL